MIQDKAATSPHPPTQPRPAPLRAQEEVCTEPTPPPHAPCAWQRAGEADVRASAPLSHLLLGGILPRGGPFRLSVPKGVCVSECVSTCVSVCVSEWETHLASSASIGGIAPLLQTTLGPCLWVSGWEGQTVTGVAGSGRWLPGAPHEGYWSGFQGAASVQRALGWDPRWRHRATPRFMPGAARSSETSPPERFPVCSPAHFTCVCSQLGRGNGDSESQRGDCVGLTPDAFFRLECPVHLRTRGPLVNGGEGGTGQGKVSPVIMFSDCPGGSGSFHQAL